MKSKRSFSAPKNWKNISSAFFYQQWILAKKYGTFLKREDAPRTCHHLASNEFLIQCRSFCLQPRMFSKKFRQMEIHAFLQSLINIGADHFATFLRSSPFQRFSMQISASRKNVIAERFSSFLRIYAAFSFSVLSHFFRCFKISSNWCRAAKKKKWVLWKISCDFRIISIAGVLNVFMHKLAWSAKQLNGW